MHIICGTKVFKINDTNDDVIRIPLLGECKQCPLHPHMVHSVTNQSKSPPSRLVSLAYLLGTGEGFLAGVWEIPRVGTLGNHRTELTTSPQKPINLSQPPPAPLRLADSGRIGPHG